MTSPVRLQLARRKGFDLQAESVARNGLPALAVTRPGPWGNPFRVEGEITHADAVRLFRDWASAPEQAPFRRDVRELLRGMNLACWCPPGPCHADVLIEIANP